MPSKHNISYEKKGTCRTLMHAVRTHIKGLMQETSQISLVLRPTQCYYPLECCTSFFMYYVCNSPVLSCSVLYASSEDT